MASPKQRWSWDPLNQAKDSRVHSDAHRGYPPKTRALKCSYWPRHRAVHTARVAAGGRPQQRPRETKQADRAQRGAHLPGMGLARSYSLSAGSDPG